MDEYENETGEKATYRKDSSDYHTLRYVRWLEERIAERDKEIERLKKDSDRYRKLRRMHCNEFQNIYVASLNGNRSFDELVDGIQTFLLDDNMIDDGFGNSWSKTCPFCKMQSMEIVRPGKAQCAYCG